MKIKNSLLSENIGEDKPPSQVMNLSKVGSFFVDENGDTPLSPFLFHNLLTRKQQDYYKSNGHSLLLKSLVVQVVTELSECKKLWEEFSPKETLFDTWNFRLAFLKGYKRSPYFLLLKNGQENMALLPLCHEEENGRYAWFGSEWQEENKFLVKDPLLIPIMLAACPSPVKLNAITSQLPDWIKDVIKLSFDDPKYILDLTSFSSSDNYLASLKKKKRHNLKRDRKIILNFNPQVILNNFSNFDELVQLSINRFRQKGETTDWIDPRRIESFRQVIRLGNKIDSYQVKMITILIGGKIAGVDLITIYKNCYSPLKCGYDVKNFPGIGSFVNLYEIDDAISLGMERIDFLEIGYGWKDKWFTQVPLLKYEKR